MDSPVSFNSREKYLNQFQRSASGEFVYCGNLYLYSDTAITRRRTLTSYWISAVLMLAASVAQGFLPADGMLSCVYVILPFIAGLLCAVSSVWALVKLTASKDPLREYIFASTVQALPIRAGFTLIFAGLSIIGECVFLLANGTSDNNMTFLLFALMLTETASALFLRKQSKVCRWRLLKRTE